jgi:hypothetical protein
VRPVRAATVALALTATLAACSGGSAGDQWRKAATKACDERASTVLVASAQLTGQSTAQQFAQFFTQFFEPAYRKQLDAMRTAGPPDDTARALVDDTAKVLDSIAADPGSFAVAVDPFTDVDARWDAYGLAACGSRTDGSGTLSSTDDSGGSAGGP